jgi:3,4-dihydroxy 2-butanone 4-phosphate synthase / GTP cyclohydrolase II
MLHTLYTNGTTAKIPSKTSVLNTIEEALIDIKAGKVIIVVDDEDRENEGDFICAAETITPEIINFMATYGRGLICTAMEEKRADELDLPLMVSSKAALHETAFTVSIDLIGHGCTTGISAYDRATGNRFLTQSTTKPSDFGRPGHIFPLRAKSGGVLRRTGHTEAAVDLTRAAGLYPMGVLVEIMNADGTMARLPQLVEIAKEHDLKIISIDDLVAYRMQKERMIKREFSTQIETKFGTFEAIAYHDITSNDTHLVLKRGTWKTDEAVLVRVHSSTETGDVLGNIFDNYGEQIYISLKKIDEANQGVLVYLRQNDKENLISKLQQYKQLQQEGDVEKFELQSRIGKKDFGVGAQILRDLGLTKIKLLTNHPRKRMGMIGYGLEIVENIELI